MKLLFYFLLTLSAHGGTIASWYGYSHANKPMANTKPFNPEAMTCASWFFPLGSKVKVTHGNRSVVLEVTDRGPARRYVRRGRKIDLSLAAFRALANPDRGLIPVKIERVK